MSIESFSVGNYLVEKKEIGKGSFSTIYKGINKISKQTYAFKQIRTNTKMKTYVEKEIKIMRSIKHSNIVFLHEVIEDPVNGYIYLVLDYCERGDFYTFQNHKPISEMYVQKYMKQLIDALQYLYDIHDIVHRDLKPQNILMDKTGNIKLTDFGFAKNNINPLTNTICGSPLYMAPEILNGHGNTYSTEKSDIWSIGIIMYEMLAGHPPYTGCKYFELRKTVKNNITLPPNVIVSESCKSLLYSLLQGNPTNRITWNDLFEHPWLNSNLIEDSENRLLAFDIHDDAKLPSIEDFEKDIKMFGSIELTNSEKNRFNESTDNELFYSIESDNIINELKDAIEPENIPILQIKPDDYSFDLIFENDYFEDKSISTSLSIDELNSSQLSTSEKFTIIHSPPNRIIKSDTSYNRTSSLTKFAKNSWNILKNSIDYVNMYGKSV